MTEKLDGFKPKEEETLTPKEQDDRTEAIETKEPELVPDGETVVPTGDEAAPMSASDPKEARKALYEKSRKNRDLVTRADADGVPDVAKIEAMVKEASGGKSDGSKLLDTNRADRRSGDPQVPDPFKDAVRRERDLKAKEAPAADPEKETKDDGAPDSLTVTNPHAKVTVVIEGKEYTVPQQDIDDAGGIAPYQKNRAATIKLQRAATLEERAHQALQALEAKPDSQHHEDPSTDGLDEADRKRLKDRLLDAVINGTEDGINDAIDEIAKSRPKALKPQPTEKRPAVSRSQEPTDTQQELYASVKADMEAANKLMRTEYKDIMADTERALPWARQRFNVLATDPNNEGRSQVELAREAAEWVREFGKRQSANPSQANEAETERQTRIERKRKLPQPSRADAPAPPAATKEKVIPSARDHIHRLRRRAGQEPT